ncbi:heparinase II/III family protein [Catellatospora sp. NPDC049609]|uniref:heparinase II/III domain-containing protein n=1 Tax=Catellatospora sp. NPDC049609 TaxID=3155505 RepID=UPI00342A51EF
MTVATPPAVVLPRQRGGWWHRYVCPVHGVELIHAGLLGGVFPAGDPLCRYGCAIDTPEVRGAWTVLAHQACAREIRRLARTGHPVDTAAAADLLEQYAARYEQLGAAEHDEADAWMHRGHLFQQALTESIWAVTIGEACKRTGAAEPLRRLLADRAALARDTLVVQDRFRSNYTAWHLAAGATCTGDPAWLTGPNGVFAHVLAATGPDGWEWEASTYYHAFVLRAYLLALRACPQVAVPAEVRERLAAMAAALTVIARPGQLPALHDGPYRRPGYDDELAELAELTAALLPQPPAGKPVTVFADAGYAVLRGPALTAIVDFGPHGGSHGHRDKLALYLYGDHVAWQPDPGQVPYGHPGWREHYASTAAHPAFSVDGREQAECTGRLVCADEHGVEVACDSAYPGVSAVRRLTLRGGDLVDELTVRAAQPSRISLHLRPDTDIQVLAGADGAVATVWSAGGQRLESTHTAGTTAFFTARPGPGPADDPQRTRTHVDWTAHDTTEVTFRTVYRSHPGQDRS